jgi:hypothetical protein
MNLIYIALFSAFIFLIVSVLFHKLSLRKSVSYFIVYVFLYLGVSYIILFDFSDLVAALLRKKGINVSLSHSDMGDIFAIVFACLLVAIINVGVVVARRYKLGRAQ